ncbi:hypothetical protein C0Q44_05910 [Paenibacillus sp. PCH8]|uniref:hypothetical protein n=1 Tax=Paenibacillus sp. PCH8 TaxID=2066524 RepID=UPI000CF8B474|nr:hypothetical protein [Paenibacillus sp. PCH8]PQP84131.1 hypothetical protein C0Q44_05910 [Paenibacillus sp. PCH8]
MKLLVWFVKIVLTVLLVSSLTLLTTGLIVQSYAKSLLASFNIQWEGQPMGLTAMFQGALGGKASEGDQPGNGTKDQPTGAEKEQVPEDAISVMGNGSERGKSGVDVGNGTSQSNSPTTESEGAGSGTDLDGGSSSGTDSGKAEGSGSAASGNGNGNGNGNGATNSGNASTGNDAIVVSPDDITGAKDKLPVEEKEKIFSLLMNKLPQKEMQQISGAMEGGLTEQELRDIEQVISKYLTSEEYDNLMEVLKVE